MTDYSTIRPTFAENGWLMMDDEKERSMSATIPGPYPTGQIPYNPGKPPVSSEQEKKPAPSIDPYVSEKDRYTISYLPEEGKRQFRENIHQYIGQLDKDYLPQQPDEANNAAS